MKSVPGVDRTANTGCCHIDLAGIGLGITDEVRDGLSRKRRIDLHDEGRPSDACDRRGVADEVEIEIVVQRRIDCIRRRGHEQCMAIWKRPHHSFSGKVSAGTGLIFGLAPAIADNRSASTVVPRLPN